MDVNTVVFIVVIVIIMLVAIFILPQWRMRRAISQVIKIFRQNNAIDLKTARTVDELGLKPRGMIDGLFRGRDYKQYALTALMKSEIIKMAEDGRLYLSEDKLHGSSFEKHNTPYYR